MSLLKLNNPDNVPGAVSTGYQAQNNMLALMMMGWDTVSPYVDGPDVILPVGGVVDVNGTLFRIISDISLPYAASTVKWIAVTDDGEETASISLVDSPGEWMPNKNGFYKDGARILNTVLGNENVTPENTGTLLHNFTTRGEGTVSLAPGWYYVDMVSGKGGGNGAISKDGHVTVSGGTPTITKTKKFIFLNNARTTYSYLVGQNGLKGDNGVHNTTGSSGTKYTTGSGGGGGGQETTFGNWSTGAVPPGKGGRNTSGSANLKSIVGGNGGGHPGSSLVSAGYVLPTGAWGGLSGGHPGNTTANCGSLKIYKLSLS